LLSSVSEIFILDYAIHGGVFFPCSLNGTSLNKDVFFSLSSSVLEAFHDQENCFQFKIEKKICQLWNNIEEIKV